METRLLEFVKTIEEREVLISEIDLLLQSIYLDKGFAFDSVVDSRIRDYIGDTIKAEITHFGIERKDYLEKIRNVINKLQVVTLEIAFQPTDRSLDTFLTFIRKSFLPDAILDVRYDPSVVAGARLFFQGHYWDLTIKELLEESLLQIKPKFTYKI